MIKTITYRSVKRFLEGISPLNERFTSPFRRYVYRGHGDSRWGLVPAAFREHTKTPCGGELVVGFKNKFRYQRDLEWEVLRDFLLEVNHHGYHIPDDRLFYNLVDNKSALQEVNSIGRYESAWPAPEYYSILALAQHYGLPTRLMDWSKSSYVALYFAVSESIKLQLSGEKVKSISLYALNVNSSLLNVNAKNAGGYWDEYYEHERPEIKYHVIETPNYLNKNMKSQQGLFLCCSDEGKIKNVEFTPVSLVEYLQKVDDDRSKGGFDQLTSMLEASDGISLYEFKISASKASEILHALDRLSVNSSNIFPSISGCVQTLYDRCVYY